MRRLEARGLDLATVRDRLWELSSDLIAVLDEAGRLVAFNSAWSATLDLSPPELQGVEVVELMHPDDQSATCAEFARLVAGAAIERFDTRLRTRAGDYRHIAWRAVREGDLIYAIGRDVTERRRREEALRQAQKLEAIGQLTGGIAHDFNNLLTIVRSSVEFLKRPGLQEDRRRRYVDSISEAVARAVKLTSQLLAFGRRQRLEPEVFDVRERIADVSELIRQLVGPRIEITTVAPEEPCCVEADLCQFETALMNLAVNARDAMEGRGRLTIEARCIEAPEAPPTVAVSVKDTGAGIAPEHLGRLFEPFFTTKAVGRGTGLGLSQVYGFVKQSGGDIEVKSAPGEGAEFTIRMPAVPDCAEARAQAARRVPVDNANPICRILVIEDNEQVGRFASDLLADLGYSPTWRRSADEAIAHLSADGECYDAVFSDVVMPGMSGLEFAELAARRWPDLPLVLTTGYSAAAVEGGPANVVILPKPYSPDELSGALRRAFQLHEAERRSRG